MSRKRNQVYFECGEDLTKKKNFLIYRSRKGAVKCNVLTKISNCELLVGFHSELTNGEVSLRMTLTSDKRWIGLYKGEVCCLWERVEM